MKTTIVLLAALLAMPGLASAQKLQLESLDRLASRASETVNVSIDPGMLKLASAFLKGGGDEAQVKELLAQLEGIYVRTFEFDGDEPYASELDAVRKQLTTGAWSRLISVDSKRDAEKVEIYSWMTNGRSAGMAIIVGEPRKLTVVNIVGPIDLTKLGALRGLGVPALP